MSDIEKFVTLAPQLVEGTKRRKYQPDVLKRLIIDGLTGGTLQSLACTSCGARFIVNKPPRRYSDYDCRVCSLGLVKVDRDAFQILRSALAVRAVPVVARRLPDAAPGSSSAPR